MKKKPKVLLQISCSELFDAVSEGVVVIDQNLAITAWNSAMVHLTGYSAEEAVGQTVNWLNFDDCRSTGNRKIEECDLFAGGSGHTSECSLVARDGSSIAVIRKGRALHDAEGTMVGAVLTLIDMREVDKLRRELIAARKQEDLQAGINTLVGRHKSMLELYRLIRLAAESEATVLLLGESGTGKELAAESIHINSHRKSKPYIRVNCSALSEHVLESELFGHVKGAFTGAYTSRTGRFEAAEGGTILLDEIGDITPAVQVKLLRVIQEKTIERVGESQTRTVDVRIITATNKNLEKLVQTGKFREDLYYRLKVLTIRVPALREHARDIPLIADHFIRKFARKTGKRITGLSPEATRICMTYSWPGNVRELENAIEHAFVVCRTDTIGIEDLPQELFRSRQHNTEKSPSDSATPASHRIKTDREQLLTLLRDCEWNKAEAARRLGISRTAVWKWMKKHKIPLSPE